jgi:hypothetical protein
LSTQAVEKKNPIIRAVIKKKCHNEREEAPSEKRQKTEEGEHPRFPGNLSFPCHHN